MCLRKGHPAHPPAPGQASRTHAIPGRRLRWKTMLPWKAAVQWAPPARRSVLASQYFNESVGISKNMHWIRGLTPFFSILGNHITLSLSSGDYSLVFAQSKASCVSTGACGSGWHIQSYQMWFILGFAWFSGCGTAGRKTFFMSMNQF